MSNDNQLPIKSAESELFGVSIRGWALIVLITTTCAMSLLQLEVKEPLYTAVISALGFYFGQKTQPNRQ